jgi:hypothetical protein
MFVMMAWLVTLAGPAEAQFTAHCLCRLATEQGSPVSNVTKPIKDFGTVATYHDVFSKSRAHEAQCDLDCRRVAGTWAEAPLDLCSAFYASNGKVR